MEKFEKMTDLQLQEKCIGAGKLYGERLLGPVKPHEDIVLRSTVENAVAAGYSKGYRDAQREIFEGLRVASKALQSRLDRVKALRGNKDAGRG